MLEGRLGAELVRQRRIGGESWTFFRSANFSMAGTVMEEVVALISLCETSDYELALTMKNFEISDEADIEVGMISVSAGSRCDCY
jgi:hypothetical protein